MLPGSPRSVSPARKKAAPRGEACKRNVEEAHPAGFADWCTTLGTVTIGKREFPIDMEALDRWMAGLAMAQSTLQALQRSRAAVVRAFLADDPDGGLQAIEDLHVRVHLIRALPLAHLGAKRRAAERELQTKGTEARRKYTADDRARWRDLRATKFAEHSESRAAALIVKECHLPEAAASSVRAELGRAKKPAKPL